MKHFSSHSTNGVISNESQEKLVNQQQIATGPNCIQPRKKKIPVNRCLKVIKSSIHDGQHKERVNQPTDNIESKQL